MLRKSLSFILVGTAAFSASYAQTPEPRTGASTTAAFGFFDTNTGYLGVETEEVTKENFSKYGLREVRGVAVEKVVDGSPAQSAGLQNGDVIVKFNGDEITSVRKLSRLINEVSPDHQARLTVLRGDDSREITITMGKRPLPKYENGMYTARVPGQMRTFQLPEMAPMAPISPRALAIPATPGVFRGFAFGSSSSRRIGVSVTPLTKQLGEHFGVDGGIMINNVRKDSPAAKAGLRAGDIIVEVDGKPVRNDFDLIRGIGEKKSGDISLTIVRDRNRQTINVTPEESMGEPGTFFEGFDGGEFTPGRRLVVPVTPAVPGTPIPLNRMYMPGRVL